MPGEPLVASRMIFVLYLTVRRKGPQAYRPGLLRRQAACLLTRIGPIDGCFVPANQQAIGFHIARKGIYTFWRCPYSRIVDLRSGWVTMCWLQRPSTVIQRRKQPG